MSNYQNAKRILSKASGAKYFLSPNANRFFVNCALLKYCFLPNNPIPQHILEENQAKNTIDMLQNSDFLTNDCLAWLSRA